MPLLLRSRLYLAALGVVLGVVGIARDDRRMIWGAIGVLGAAVVLRFVARALSARRDRASGGS
ncbi:MAG TPA: hypothetical protein VFU45_07615 [Gemmatimonadales bacterium]|nr:hypothetical protein [Gemmatimonadales bacterium]